MIHQYSEVVNFQYDRKHLYSIITNIVNEHKLFENIVPISSFKKEHKQQILQTLNMKYEDNIFGVNVRHVTIACLKPNQVSAIHVDRNEKNEPITIALNIPVTKCNNVVMRWYQKRPGAQDHTIKSAQGFDIPGLKRGDSIVVHTQACDKPFIVNPSYFHDIINEGSSNEYIISIRTGVTS